MSNKDEARDLYLTALESAFEKLAEACPDSEKSTEIIRAIFEASESFLAVYDANRLMLGLLSESYADCIVEQARHNPEKLQQEVYIDAVYDKYQSGLFLLLDVLYSGQDKSDLVSHVSALAQSARDRAHQKLHRQG